METRANYVLIGVFTLAVVVGIFAFVWWFQRLGTGEAKATYEIYFDGPVSGLRRGAGVNFNGIRVGEVQSLALVPDIPRAVVAIVEVAKSTPIRTDTKVTLEYQGLTGIASVALIGGDPEGLDADGNQARRPAATHRCRANHRRVPGRDQAHDPARQGGRR